MPPGVSHPSGAVADPLGKFWSDLDWLVVDGPEAARALDDLSRIIDVVMDEEHHPIVVAIDVDALLEEMRLRSGERRRPTETEIGRFDPLRAYLEDLGSREAPAMMLPGR